MNDENCSCTQPGPAIQEIDALAAKLKALAHPARMEIVRQLQQRECCCCGDFCDALELAQSTVSQHLELLRKAGFVDYQPEGTRSRYRLNHEAFRSLADAIGKVAAPFTLTKASGA
jgi:ArsR family transcriptional regulator, arsenate/arsenite/antimonite-responsive transcriptional repressor